MIPRPPGSTRTDTLFPYTTLFRSPGAHRIALVGEVEANNRDVVRLDPHGADAAAEVGREATVAELQVHPDVAHEGQRADVAAGVRSEEHTSELQSLMRISYAVFCLKKKT